MEDSPQNISASRKSEKTTSKIWPTIIGPRGNPLDELCGDTALFTALKVWAALVQLGIRYAADTCLKVPM